MIKSFRIKNIEFGLHPFWWWILCVKWLGVDIFYKWVDADCFCYDVPTRHYNFGPIWVDIEIGG